jgi:1-acyl-sn-glycerol-3-phosphate acyltransferase
MNKNIVTYLLYPVSVFILISSFIALILPISVVALPFKWQTRRTLTGKFWQAFGHVALRVVCLARIFKDDRRPKEVQKQSTPVGLHIANHSSFIDIPLMLTTMQVPPIMKKEILYIPFLGICAYSSGAIIVDRKAPDSRKKVFRAATKRLTHYDKSLQYYPEGTRQRENKGPKDVSVLKKPLMEFAYRQNIPLYPISFYGTRKVLTPKGLIHYGQKIGAIFHAPIHPQNFRTEEEFIEKAWATVQAGYYELEAKLN